MKVMRITLLTAFAACISTAAMAGGFDFNSRLGVWGKAAYADAAAFGEAKYKGPVHGDEAGSGSYSINAVNTRTTVPGYWAPHTTGAHADASQTDGCFGGAGMCDTQSHTGSVAGSLIGDGHGYKSGSFSVERTLPVPRHRLW